MASRRRRPSLGSGSRADTGHPEREERVLELVHRTAQGLRVLGMSDWLALELTMAQLKALVLLAHDGPISMGTVATALGVGSPSTSQVVDRLVHLGLATRKEDATDRRRTLVDVTTSGRHMVDELFEGHRRRVRSLLRRLEGADLEALEQGLVALCDAMGDVHKRTGPKREAR